MRPIRSSTTASSVAAALPGGANGCAADVLADALTQRPWVDLVQRRPRPRAPASTTCVHAWSTTPRAGRRPLPAGSTNVSDVRNRDARHWAARTSRRASAGTACLAGTAVGRGGLDEGVGPGPLSPPGRSPVSPYMSHTLNSTVGCPTDSRASREEHPLVAGRPRSRSAPGSPLGRIFSPPSQTAPARALGPALGQRGPHLGAPRGVAARSLPSTYGEVLGAQLPAAPGARV